MEPSAAEDHESNGAIESANAALRIFVNRISSMNKKSPIANILAEATYGKSIYNGSKLASSFELLYSMKPPIMGNIKDRTRIVTLAENVAICYAPSTFNTGWRLDLFLMRQEKLARTCEGFTHQ